MPHNADRRRPRALLTAARRLAARLGRLAREARTPRGSLPAGDPPAAAPPGVRPPAGPEEPAAAPPGRRTRMRALAWTTVCALALAALQALGGQLEAGTTAALGRLTHGSRHASSPASPTASAPPTASGAPPPRTASTVSATPTVSTTSASPAASAGAPSPSGGGGTSVGTGPAVSVGVTAGFGCEDSGYVFPAASGVTAASRLGGGPKRDGGTWDTAPTAFGALPAAPTGLYLVLTGHVHHAVTITGLTLHVSGRHRAPSGGVVANVVSQCGSGPDDAVEHVAAADLDRSPPYWLPHPALPTDLQRADRMAFPYTATAARPVILDLTVSAERSDCVWWARLFWVDGTARGHTDILDRGHRFRLAPATGLRSYVWDRAEPNAPPDRR